MKNLKRRIKLAELAAEKVEKETKAAIEFANDLEQFGTVKNLLIVLNSNNETLIKLRNARL